MVNHLPSMDVCISSSTMHRLTVFLYL